MMIIYHILYDLSYFGGYAVDVRSGFWLNFARVTASIFIMLVGISLTLSASKAKLLGYSGDLQFLFLKRGLKIFSLGMAITLATYFFIGRDFILFGVLHFIGISIILAYPFLRLHIFNFLSGLIIILTGIYLQGHTFDEQGLFWLGLMPEGFHTLDYFPLFPWFGLVLIGLFLGNSLYKSRQRCFDLPDLSGSSGVELLGTLGRSSLPIYLFHQPVLIAILSLSGVIYFPWPA